MGWWGGVVADTNYLYPARWGWIKNGSIFMLDFGIERLEGLQYYHWLMANEFGFGIIDQFVVMAELSH